ncbi:cytochrome c oxidase subunit 3 family protein [Mycobacterium angelicum]|uniref:Probable cytochrome c oxidase subunit 3 n=1 Tax=Mycobacterium angelicum TaxID=470074 RepID=A0A1X0A430_MYCAN|nr:cytochrome c oxidase subunit 3 family protein [Mycobacterium angelicum]MCV7197794.1 cytochrome c oxidase subunit 3 family protein [Mycobacterium angelicum]ORA24810.1 cytochrome C oxidase subunit III [Mycobacterium angelicum]
MTDLADERKLAKFVPGQPDMWAFVLFETLVFTGYFGFYLFYRARSPELFLHAQAHLDLRIGVFNTLVLLLSSWSVARCVQSSRAGAYRAAHRDVYVTAACAAIFLFFKVFEWTRLVGTGNGPDSNDFFTYYFFLTGIHFVHLLIGFVVLVVIVYQLRSPARRSQELVETCATYWHTVDFLWVLIFALLYVVR